MYGPAKFQSLDLASGLTSPTNPIDLGSAWDRVYVEIPTFASGGTHYIQATNESGGTFRRVYALDPADGGDNVWQTLSSQAIIPIPAGFRYYKVENTTGCTDATTTYNFHYA